MGGYCSGFGCGSGGSFCFEVGQVGFVWLFVIDPVPDVVEVGEHVLVVGNAYEFVEHVEESIEEVLSCFESGGMWVLVVVVKDGFECLEAGVLVDEEGVDGEEGVVLFGVLLPSHQLHLLRQLTLIHLISPNDTPQ